MVEREGHRQLVEVGVGVADAVVDGGGAHLADGDHVIDAGLADQLLEVLVNVRAVGVEPSSVSLVVVLPDGGLGDEVHDVEAEARDPLGLPEAHDVDELGAHLGVVPVEVCLALVKEVQVPLVERGDVLPGAATELADPVGRGLAGVLGGRVWRGVDELVVREVARVPREGAPEPLVARRGMVEHHVEHEADSMRLGLAGELVEVVHRAEHRLDRAIVGHVIAVVVLRRDEEGRDPEVVHAEMLEVVEAVRDAAQVADAVAVGVLEAADVDLVDDLVSERACAIGHDGAPPGWMGPGPWGPGPRD